MDVLGSGGRGSSGGDTRDGAAQLRVVLQVRGDGASGNISVVQVLLTYGQAGLYVERLKNT